MNERLTEILRIALAYQVSDIHFSLDENGRLVIEMRVGGKIRILKSDNDDERLFRYLMYKANLDVSSVFMPQTGSFEQTVDGRRLSLRFAIVSAWHRVSGVLRILSATGCLRAEDLCSDEQTVNWMRTALSKRSGLVIFSGPTGSGKTTALYTLLDEISERKIFTLEDPVEVVHENYVQLQVSEKQMTYADGIRQLMRHDPDIIMIGEIRDSEAARMAVRSALTGHLVVTSLHSFSCTGAIERMIDLGVPESQLAAVLSGVSCQRLYPCTEGGKTGIYEFMDKAETAYWFANGKVSENFIPLAQKIREAVSLGIISPEEAEADLA